MKIYPILPSVLSFRSLEDKVVKALMPNIFRATREMHSDMKKKNPSPQEAQIDGKIFPVETPWGQEVSLTLKVKRSPIATEPVCEGVAIRIVADKEEQTKSYILEIRIRLPLDVSDNMLQDISHRTSMAVSHELTHFFRTKVNSKEKKQMLQDSYYMDSKSLSKLEYVKRKLLGGSEPEAYVRGFMTMAKRTRRPVVEVMSEWLRQTLSLYSTLDLGEQNILFQEVIQAWESKLHEIYGYNPKYGTVPAEVVI